MNCTDLDTPRLLPLGDSAWTVEFADRIDPAIHGRVMALEALVADARHRDPVLACVIDLVPTFRSLTVHFDARASDPQVLGQRLLSLAANAASSEIGGRHWRLPACFDADLAPDLAMVAERHGTNTHDVVDLLCQTRFRVYMIGFMPGFPYMGGLPASLHTPRLATPRKVVPARSIAIAGEMCAVYPWQSPGGWNLLGSTPLPLFSAHESVPALLASGDFVSWQAVDRTTYQQIEADFAQGQCRREDFLSQGELR